MMDEYGFDGLDIDWEYPVADGRGGSKDDFKNYVMLLKEARDAFGSKYGLTIAIPASYYYGLSNHALGYLKGLDVKNMAKYVDWFNFMSYDIHGVWDSQSKWTREVINSHTNLTEISTGLDLLWRKSIPPEKVLLGLAFYGRSFTLADPSCNTPGLARYLTTKSAKILKKESPKVVHDAEAGVKWITWDTNQWVSYDDAKTLKRKADFASGLCLGGSFAWALTQAGPGTLSHPSELKGEGLEGADPKGKDSGSGEVFIGTEVFKQKNPRIACVPPCTFVMPSFPLNNTTTIFFPPYTTSLEVVWPTTTVVTQPNGGISTSTGLFKTIQTTTLNIPRLVTSVIDLWNWRIERDMSTIIYAVSSSILPPPFVITDHPRNWSDDYEHTFEATGTEYSHTMALTNVPSSFTGVTRTITPPPLPYTSQKGRRDNDLPALTFSVGPPGPLCTKDCGKKWKRFCGGPCEHDCDGQSRDFVSPIDPDPPKNIRKCAGKDCKKRKCTSPLCVRFGCHGLDCVDGVCLGPRCRVTMCGGGRCGEGCTGLGCKKSGCIGECSLDGTCLSLRCTSFGCIGLDCGSDGICSGPRCKPVWCRGLGCKSGQCSGPDCKEGERGCDKKNRKTVSRCTEILNKILTNKKKTHYSTSTRKRCSQVTGCNVEATTVTTTVSTNLYEVYTVSEYILPQPTQDEKSHHSLAEKLLELRKSRDANRFGAVPTKTASPKTTGKVECKTWAW
ncbi:hypothetical protein AJ80_09479 [Polytolypa hystricis UAMH7299]|uniref:chitinase n=1 Tax=Polytolypa hystricis (strain UAMH7299) TaxID=1447883 RepID=A0A2B7WQ42_POLH7|nr:hypothetical protein AJ80_09479 [Polytolypa hystricis UAMH7299]